MNKLYKIKPVKWIDESTPDFIYITSSNCGSGSYCFTNTRHTLDELRKDIPAPKEPRLWFEPDYEGGVDAIVEGVSTFEESDKVANERLRKYLGYYLEGV